MIFLAFTWNCETVELRDVDLILDLGVDGQLTRFNICLTQLAKTTLSNWPIFLPDAFVFILFTLLHFPLLFIVLKSKNHLAKFVFRNYKRIFTIP